MNRGKYRNVNYKLFSIFINYRSYGFSIVFCKFL